jgi:hypothetical protein
MIACIGDVHRSFNELEQIVADLPESVSHIVQLGDLQVWPMHGMPPGTHDLNLPRPMFFIDGNWDYFPWLRGHREPVEIMPNLTYVPRGTILELDGRRVAFLGGAESISDYRRTRGINWWPDEEGVRDEDLERFPEEPVDLLLTHSPPASVVQRIFRDNAPPPMLSGTPSLMDAFINEDPSPAPSAFKVQAARARLGNPTVVSGHLHRSAHFADAHVLGMLEVLLL